MPRNGSGSYTLPIPDFVAGAVLTDTQLDSQFADIAAALTASIAKDGQTTPTANLPMGNFKHLGVADATARTHYASARQVTDGGLVYAGTTAGTATALTATLTPAITAYATGEYIIVKVNANSTTAATTLNVNGVGAKTIKRFGRDIRSGDWLTDDILVLGYDGTNLQLLSPCRPVLRGCVAMMSAAQTITSSTLTKVNFAAEAFDTDAIHDTVTNNTRLTVPTGVTGVQLGVVGFWENDNTGVQRYANILKNNTTSIAALRALPAGSNEFTLTTAPLIVSAADYFEAQVYHEVAGGLDFGDTVLTQFWMTILQ